MKKFSWILSIISLVILVIMLSVFLSVWFIFQHYDTQIKELSDNQNNFEIKKDFTTEDNRLENVDLISPDKQWYLQTITLGDGVPWSRKVVFYINLVNIQNKQPDKYIPIDWISQPYGDKFDDYKPIGWSKTGKSIYYGRVDKYGFGEIEELPLECDKPLWANKCHSYVVSPFRDGEDTNKFMFEYFKDGYKNGLEINLVDVLPKLDKAVFYIHSKDLATSSLFLSNMSHFGEKDAKKIFEFPSNKKLISAHFDEYTQQIACVLKNTKGENEAYVIDIKTNEIVKKISFNIYKKELSQCGLKGNYEVLIEKNPFPFRQGIVFVILDQKGVETLIMEISERHWLIDSVEKIENTTMNRERCIYKKLN